jgi:hypothetical protein
MPPSEGELTVKPVASPSLGVAQYDDISPVERGYDELGDGVIDDLAAPCADRPKLGKAVCAAAKRIVGARAGDNVLVVPAALALPKATAC